MAPVSLNENFEKKSVRNIILIEIHWRKLTMYCLCTYAINANVLFSSDFLELFAHFCEIIFAQYQQKRKRNKNGNK